MSQDGDRSIPTNGWDRLQLRGAESSDWLFAVNASRLSYKQIRTPPIALANAVYYVPTVLR